MSNTLADSYTKILDELHEKFMNGEATDIEIAIMVLISQLDN